jgi:membrane associated rhomboid family serine protease
VDPENHGMRFLGPVIGALVGMGAFYMAGAFIMCDFVMPNSNLCGLPSVFFAAPVGLLAGAVVGWRLARPRSNA